jgi:hypothetical protein
MRTGNRQISGTVHQSGRTSGVALLLPYKDLLWASVWFGGVGLIWLWDLIFLNAPAHQQVWHGFFNTLTISCLVIIFTACAAWFTANILHYLHQAHHPGLLLHTVNFLLNLLRSVPQIIGVLFGYILLTAAMQDEVISRSFFKLCAMAGVLSTFIFLELHDLFLERIDHFQRLDFCNAMRVCGITEFRIVNREILFANSRAHIFDKLIAIFGTAVFLQCSIDFIVSVGLSMQLSPVNFPLTLGSMLAKIDSKQDILAIGHSLTNWSYAGNLFTRHLQGISAAFLIVFTLLCIHKISAAYGRRRHL